MKKLKLFALFLFFTTAFSAVKAQNAYTIEDSIESVWIQIHSWNHTNNQVYRVQKSNLAYTQTSGGVLSIYNFTPQINIRCGTDSVTAVDVNGVTHRWTTVASVNSLGAYVGLLANAGMNKKYIAANTYTTVKANSYGLIHSINIDSIGSGGLAVFRVWDGTDTTVATGNLIGSFSAGTVGLRLLDIKFSKGLYIKSACTVAPHITVSYYLRDPDEYDAVYNIKQR